MKASNKQMVALTKAALLVGVLVVTGTCIVPVFHEHSQTQAQVGVPDPRIDYIYLNGSPADSVTVTRGTTVIVEVQATNVGTAPGYRTGIYISFPEFDSDRADSLVDLVSLSSTGGDADLRYAEHAPGNPDDRIWYACNTGYFGMAQQLLVAGYAPSVWEPGEAIRLAVRVTPPAPGTFQVYVKAVTSDATSGGSYYYDPTDGMYTDQQCQPVYRRTIEVGVGSYAVYMPVVFKSYWSTLVRGVRMQAPSCYGASYCSRRLDCLQAADVNTVYYTVYYDGRAYYRSALMSSHSFDSLAYIIPQAHARGMQVYALITVALLGWPEHPEWNARLNHPGVTADWLDFAVPEARSFVADVSEELVTRYDVDGILLDYIRWDSAWYRSANLSPDGISQTVRAVYERVKRVRSIPVAASVFKCGWSAERVGQMWYDWLSGGYIDHVTPMAYVEDSELRVILNEWRNSGYFPSRIVPRLSLAWFDPTRARPVGDVSRQIQMCHNAGAAGVALWDDRYMCDNSNLVEILGDGGW